MYNNIFASNVWQGILEINSGKMDSQNKHKEPQMNNLFFKHFYKYFHRSWLWVFHNPNSTIYHPESIIHQNNLCPTPSLFLSIRIGEGYLGEQFTLRKHWAESWGPKDKKPNSMSSYGGYPFKRYKFLLQPNSFLCPIKNTRGTFCLSCLFTISSTYFNHTFYFSYLSHTSRLRLCFVNWNGII